MRLFRHYNELPGEVRASSVAVGNFDGVHRGHLAVIGEAGRIAHANGLPWAVLTLEPHPRQVFKPDTAPFRLTPLRIKARHIEALGVDALIVLHFDLEFSRRSARTFIEDVLVEGLGARHVVCGYDFTFGHDRAGNPELLLRLGGELGFDFTCVQEVRNDSGEALSSTRVRQLLSAGDPAGAAAILGRPYEVEGRVDHGDHRGRTIGYPTANVHLGEYLRPVNGVYAVRAGVDEGARTVWYNGVANLGRRPTFGGDDVLLEAHLFDFSGDLYGRHLRVQFVEYLRAEKAFDGLDGLKAQIAADGARAREVLAAS